MKGLTFSVGLGLAAYFAVSPALAAERAAEEDVAAAEADERDRRREVELFWLRPTAGYGYVDLTTFQANEENLTADLIPTSLSGPAFALGAGVRVLFISFGVSGGAIFFSDAARDAVDETQLWTLDGNVLLHLLTGYRIEPYIQLGAGYQAFGGLGDYSIHGWNAHAGVGLDVFLNDDVSIGGLLTGNLSFMTRPGRSASDLLTPQEVETTGELRDRLLEADGSSAGAGLALMVGPSFHF
ncbi:MAG TPA: hypothetical protein VM686_34315 [Polyangiaceae bacterium]|nr:hypothetical protein [Polyangiaceae bacterium]